MLRFLFPRLTPALGRGDALFAAITAKAREPHWYVDGQVPDTLDGRFRMLATLAALAVVRLEREGETGEILSVALTERFIEVMESEHRELGLGDPKLGRTVRKLVGSLARRVELWRSAVAGSTGWEAAVRESTRMEEAGSAALDHKSAALRHYWEGLEKRSLTQIAEGQLG